MFSEQAFAQLRMGLRNAWSAELHGGQEGGNVFGDDQVIVKNAWSVELHGGKVGGNVFGDDQAVGNVMHELVSCMGGGNVFGDDFQEREGIQGSSLPVYPSSYSQSKCHK